MSLENGSGEYSREESERLAQKHEQAESKADEVADKLVNANSGDGNRFSAEYLSQELDKARGLENEAKQELDSQVELGHNEALLEKYNRDKEELFQLKFNLNESSEGGANRVMGGSAVSLSESQLDTINNKFTEIEEKRLALLELSRKLEGLGIQVD